MQDERDPGIVDRIDHLTAAVADLGFRLDSLVASTSSFRDALAERLTDYADLVARWSIEADENLTAYRRAVTAQAGLLERIAAAVEAVPAGVTGVVADAVGKAERRTVEAVESVSDSLGRRLDGLVADLRALGEAGADEPDMLGDAMAAVLAEVAAVRREVAALPRPEPQVPPQPVDLTPVLEAVAAIRIPEPPPAPEPVDLTPLVDAVGAMRPTTLDETVDELRGLRRELARFPDSQAEVSRLAEEINELREALAEAAADDVEEAEESEGSMTVLGDQVAALRIQVAALTERLAERPPVPPEVTALTAELHALRAELDAEPEPAPAAAPMPEPVDLEPVRDALAELTFEVRALKRRIPLRAPKAD